MQVCAGDGAGGHSAAATRGSSARRRLTLSPSPRPCTRLVLSAPHYHSVRSLATNQGLTLSPAEWGRFFWPLINTVSYKCDSLLGLFLHSSPSRRRRREKGGFRVILALCVKPEFTLLCLECCQHSKGDDARVMWREKVGLMMMMMFITIIARD